MSDQAVKRAALHASLNQRVQVRVWDYMNLPPHERDGVKLGADLIYMVASDDYVQDLLKDAYVKGGLDKLRELRNLPDGNKPQ